MCISHSVHIKCNKHTHTHTHTHNARKEVRNRKRRLTQAQARTHTQKQVLLRQRKEVLSIHQWPLPDTHTGTQRQIIGGPCSLQLHFLMRKKNIYHTRRHPNTHTPSDLWSSCGETPLTCCRGSAVESQKQEACVTMVKLTPAAPSDHPSLDRLSQSVHTQ